MVRTVLIALLVALALPLGVAGASANSGSPDADLASLDEISILTIGEDSRTSFARPTLDIGTATALQREAAKARLERYAIESELARSTSTEARQALLLEAATDVEIRISTLRDRERTLRTAYANREIGTGTFVRQLAMIHARVGLLRTTLNVIGANAEKVPEFSMRSRLQLLETALFGFEGPVRERALAALSGKQAASRLFVRASNRGVVLATIENGEYVREAYRADHLDPETVSGISLSEAADRTSEFYPVAYNSSVSLRIGTPGLSGGLFRIDIDLREGSIEAFLDRATQDVFFEVQKRELDLLGPRPTVAETANGTRLVVARTYGGGPMEIRVTDNETGDPLQRTVLVAGTELETGTDGTAWTLAPSTVTFEVRVLGPTGNVTTTVRPFSPVSVTSES